MRRCNRTAVIARHRSAEREQRNIYDLDLMRAILEALTKWQCERRMQVTTPSDPLPRQPRTV